MILAAIAPTARTDLAREAAPCGEWRVELSTISDVALESLVTPPSAERVDTSVPIGRSINEINTVVDAPGGAGV